MVFSVISDFFFELDKVFFTFSNSSYQKNIKFKSNSKKKVLKTKNLKNKKPKNIKKKLQTQTIHQLWRLIFFPARLKMI